MYSALAVSGHYMSFGPTTPISSERKQRILEEMDTAEKAMQRVSHTDEGERNGSFGRLKVKRVRDLVKESHRRKKIGSVSDLEEATQFHLPIASFEQSDVLDGRNNLTSNYATSTASDCNVHYVGRDVFSLNVSRSFSKGWQKLEQANNFHSKKYGISKAEEKPNHRDGFFSRKSFKELGCSDYMIESLRKVHYKRPSHIQAVAFASVLKGNSCIIADQSGSGKTLSYLLPLIQRLRQEELERPDEPAPQSSRVIILVPTAELASQVLNCCRSLSKVGVPFRSMVATGGFRQKTQLENLRQEIDILIATPGRLMYLINEGFLQLRNLQSIVLDEVDILCKDEDFMLAFQSLANSAPVTVQYLFVTATLPVEIYNRLVEIFPDCDVIMGPGMHRTSPGLEEILVDCSGDDKTDRTPATAFINKKNALLEIMKQSPVMKTIVFCNKIETCRKVENALKRFDKKEISTIVLPFHSALEQESRLANMKEFHSMPEKNICMFLVCTDRASRGIDFAGVDHVVLFDFPRDPSEYVRRVGRTARGSGGKGKAFVFVVGKQVSLARRIIERNVKGHPLHAVPSAHDVLK